NKSITASTIAPTVAFTEAPASGTYNSEFTVSATTNASTIALVTASGACSISGNVVTMTSGTGTWSLTASWAADANYSSATANQSAAATGNGTPTPPTISAVTSSGLAATSAT